MSTEGTDATPRVSTAFRASQQDGTYPRPQLMRPEWFDLSGNWAFAYDDADEGLDARWYDSPAFDRTIVVPFPPESARSGIHDSGYHRVVWYSRELSNADLAAAGDHARMLVHFGAVDYRASVWLNGRFLGSHEGGHTPFSFDVTAQLDAARDTQTLVVRAEDDPLDVSQPRGKQDWLPEPHVIWYSRTTGIWQPVWLESVPTTSVRSLHWSYNPERAEVRLGLLLRGRPAAGSTVSVTLRYDGAELGSTTVPVTSDRLDLVVGMPAQQNGQGYEQLLWSPLHPRLIDAEVVLSTGGETVDAVQSYLGLRTVGTAQRTFQLNDRPVYLRSVLSQGFWPDSHLAAPTPDALRAEVQLIKDLGFNAARVHQKIEDPRLLFWADRLGLLIWEELPSAFEFGETAMRRSVAEWSEAIDRDFSHPCIVTWVPLNESWGVQHIARSQQMRDYADALYSLTKALDPTRLAISNDGWEHVRSDIWSVHDYEWSGEVLRARYADDASREALFAGPGPAGRQLRVTDDPYADQPVMLTEFGCVQFSVHDDGEDAW
ncbi:MAG: hypothetical protein QOI02_200, partial [Actinomycetota bacterium]|nr:hypothetical protein [Actinomycetota bacterium]